MNEHYPNIGIYADYVKQGFKRPCFYINTQLATETQGLFVRSVQKHTIRIRYFSKYKNDEKMLKDCNEMGQSLLGLFEIIYVEGDKDYCLANRKVDIDLDALEFSGTVSYNFSRRTEYENMNTLEINVRGDKNVK